ncbi:MAG: hypothetical protein AMXMBFR64_58720 [Myxococcales bacterium]
MNARTAPAFLRWRTLDGRHLITNEHGEWHWLPEDDLRALLAGRLPTSSPQYEALSRKGFLAATFDASRALERLSRRMRAVRSGPNLHVLVVTLRCNHSCQYCHASRAPMDRVDTDMSPETADRVLDVIFQSPSPAITIEFQGGEPLANFPVIRHVIEGARARNDGRALSFSLVTNLSLMDEEKLAYLIDRRVQICTSLDGPEDIHNQNRKWAGGNSFQTALSWVRRINQAWDEAGLDPTLYRVEALPTVTRAALPRWKELVDTYVAAGCRSLFLRPLDPFGFASRTGDRLGYRIRDFLDFYANAVTYMIQLNLEGVEVLERNAGIFLTKILSGEEPNFLDIRSPCGAGIGQVAYNHDGQVFTCDEGRMVHEMGDPAFLIGDARDDSWASIIAHPTVRSLVMASTLDGQPGCSTCAYKPYCGVCPVVSYEEQGSIHGRTLETTICQKHMGIQDFLFRLLRDADRPTLDVLRRWTTVREQTHFIQECARL